MKIMCENCGHFVRYEEPFANLSVQTEPCTQSPCSRRLQHDIQAFLQPRPITTVRGHAIAAIRSGHKEVIHI